MDFIFSLLRKAYIFKKHPRGEQYLLITAMSYSQTGILPKQSDLLKKTEQSLHLAPVSVVCFGTD